MRILLHMCCGPCSITVIQGLLDDGCEVEGFFYNPNVQPLSEYLRRREGVWQVAEKLGIPVHWPEDALEEDSLVPWLRMVNMKEDERCLPCWSLRLRETAAKALAGGFDAFATSLLYSRRQNHEGIAEAGGDIGKELGVSFLYRDFRPTWQQGINLSKEWGIYRQPYCGCIYSEYDRYKNELKKVLEKK